MRIGRFCIVRRTPVNEGELTIGDGLAKGDGGYSITCGTNALQLPKSSFTFLLEAALFKPRAFRVSQLDAQGPGAS